MISPLPFDFSLANIRHAHSHLMFFGWAGLMPLFLISKFFQFQNTSATISKWSLRSIFILSLLTYPSFLMWGYKPVAIGDSNIPISAILSGFVMIGWYMFIFSFYKHQQKSNSYKNEWLSSALIALFLSSLGAWGVGLVGIIGVESLFISKALTHTFLSVFTEGWILLFILGFLAHQINLKNSDFTIPPNIIIWMILVGAPLSFAFGMAEHTNASFIMLWARFGSLLMSLALIMFLIELLKAKDRISTIYILPIFFLFIKALTQLSIAAFGFHHLTSDPTLRVLYLHILLLGAFTLLISSYIVKAYQIKTVYYHILSASVALTILSLILPTPLRPLSWGGVWIYDALAIGALLPIVSICFIWIKSLFSSKTQSY